MKLQQKIICLFIVVLILSIGSITILSFYQMRNLLETQVSKDMLDVTNSIAENYVVKGYFGTSSNVSNEILNNEIEKLRQKLGVQFIVVMDMKGVRQTHPIKEKIGKRFEGGDEKAVLTKGEEYVSIGKGSFGPSFRVFAPIYEGNKQVGAVCIGIIAENYYNQINERMKKFIPFIVLGLALGIWGAVLLSYNIKKTILGLEPEEITLILKQKETVLETIKEGIICVDEQGKITLFNREAGIILGLEEADIGRPITDFVYGNRIEDALGKGESIENIEVKIRPGVSIISKFTPLRNEKNKLIGILINFRNLTEVRKLAEELTGIKKMAWSLRAQNHEFMNKLHTISGLIQLEEYEEVLKFINSIADERKNINTIVTKKIKDIPLAALLLAKYSRAEESRVKLIIDENSSLKKLPKYITSEELVSLVGNILENSLDEVKNDGSGEIYIKVYEENDMLKIFLKDNGRGIREDIAPHIYEMGVSSKEGQRGYGMYLVKNIVDEARGTINFEVNNGTAWYIDIPMGGSVEDDKSNDC